ncbi:MAG: MAPEG family protein [Rhodospirillaceae bacterium]|nr:MAPEG family protein [Rhodospirillaceae bacterium]
MQMPSITATYLAILALIYVALGLQVVRLRRRHRAGFGDGGNEALRSAIRAHGHFAEYVPLITLMVAFLEMSGLPAAHVHKLMGMLLLSRILHPFGMYAKPGSLQFRVGRIGGMLLTIAVTVISALTILQRALFPG